MGSSASQKVFPPPNEQPKPFQFGIIYKPKGKETADIGTLWDTQDFTLIVAKNGKLTGVTRYNDKDTLYPMYGEIYNNGTIEFHQLYDGSVYKYNGTCYDTIMNGYWKHIEYNNKGNRGIFEYKLNYTTIDTTNIKLFFVHKGKYVIKSNEVSDIGTQWTSPNATIYSNGNKINGQLIYHNYQLSYFTGTCDNNGFYTFELSYENEIYVYWGIFLIDCIVGRWNHKKTKGPGVCGSFVWKLELDKRY